MKKPNTAQTHITAKRGPTKRFSDMRLGPKPNGVVWLNEKRVKSDPFVSTRRPMGMYHLRCTRYKSRWCTSNTPEMQVVLPIDALLQHHLCHFP